MKKTINRIFTVVFLATIFLVFGMSARTLPPDSNKQFWKGETELSFLADINDKSFVNETNSNLSPAATFTVNLTSDEEDFNVGDGICDANSAVAGNQCTLRAAIQEANATTDPDNINFLIPISGLQVIQLAASLPAITSPVVINGYTQPGSSPNTLAVGNNAVFRIRINSNGHNALNVTAGNSTIRGLLFTVKDSVAVSLQNNGNNLVEGCWFGLFADGTAFSSPNSINIWVLSNNNVIGGAAPQSRNVISNSTNQGIILAGNNNTVQNNYIGTDPSGTQPRSNNNDGIFIQGSDNLIGGTNGITAGNCTGECNRIAFNNKGVVLESGNTGMLLTNNRILGNSIYSNSSLGIDLDDDGVTLNDLNDPDIGANNAQNFPVILSATNGGGTKVQGTFNSTANRTFRLEFFNSAENDASGYGEGQFFIGSTDVETDASGNAGYDQTFAYNSPTGSYVSATATDLTTGDTSEFAQSKQVSCGYSLSATFLNIAAAGGNGNVNVSGGDGCGWTAVSNDEWITITGGGSGTGNGAVSFTVAANTGEARTGTITVAGQTFTVNQASGCAFSISPTSANITSEGDSGSFALTASNSGCAWSAVSPDEWITITSDASGTGDTTVEFTVDASDVPARSGTITIGGLTFTINQAGGCAFSISPTSANVPAGSGTDDFDVSSGAGCEWTAVSNDDWITITGSGSGTGDGKVTYAFEANTGAARTGTITVNDKTFTVNQASGCTYSLSPTNANFTAEGGTDDFDVTAVEGCAWTATTDDDWITINSGGTGDGNGTVSFSVEANTGAARTGTITVNGQTFTVTQASGCTFSLLPTSMTIGAASGNGNVNVTSGSGCEWTAVSNAEWITVTSGAEGTGNGTVQFTATASDVPERTGTITIGGQTFTVKQVSSCTYTLSATSADVSFSGENGSVNVTTGSECDWNAVSSAEWITITSGATGTGNGTVNFTVAANTGEERTGTITIGGQTFTVTQEAVSCSFTLSPASPQSFTAAAGDGTINITVPTGCAWEAVNNTPSMITITGGNTGNGNGVVSFAVTENLSSLPRNGSITIGEQIYTINQAGVTCSYAISPASAVISAQGVQNNSFTITTNADCSWTAVSGAPWITTTSSDNGSGAVNFTVAANNTSSTRTTTITAGGQVFTVHQAGLRPTMFDFDGDKKTDISVFRPSDRVWYLLRSQAGYTTSEFGLSTDKLAPADYDGDRKTDIAVFRESNGKWYILQSSNRALVEMPAFGQAGDIPVPGDWDGDGKADVAVYREGANPGDQSYFYYRGTLNNPDGNIAFVPFGQNGDIPLIGDYDGDGKQDAVIFRPSVGEWWYLRSSDGGNRAFQFGQDGDKPLSGDFTGDGKTDIAIFRPSTGEWFILRSEDYSYYSAPFGGNGDIPVVGDYDGDGMDDIAIWRPSDGNWYVAKSSEGFLIAPFGSSGDRPVPSAFVP